jgi:hypothetical protein
MNASPNLHVGVSKGDFTGRYDDKNESLLSSDVQVCYGRLSGLNNWECAKGIVLSLL